MKVDHDRAGGTLELGLSLGRFASKEAAERELTNLGTRACAPPVWSRSVPKPLASRCACLP